MRRGTRWIWLDSLRIDSTGHAYGAAVWTLLGYVAVHVAIGAAMALIRFRIKVDTKTVNMGLFYRLLTGMAVGIDQVPIAYAISYASAKSAE